MERSKAQAQEFYQDEEIEFDYCAGDGDRIRIRSQFRESVVELNNLSNSKPSSPSFCSERRNSAIHGSMENIHHPKNYRRSGFTPSPKTRKVNNSDPSPLNQNHNECDVRAGPSGSSRNMNMSNLSGSAAIAADSTALYQYIAEEKHKILLRKAVTTLVYGALKKQSHRVLQLETLRQRKTEESAARLILHSLLLNSWRTARLELDRLSKENAQLSISVSAGLNVSISHIRYTIIQRLIVT